MPTKKPAPKLAKPQPKKPQPKPENKPVVREIDATGRVLGRLATEAAVILRGKDKVNFQRHLVCGDRVSIINAAKIVVTGNKMEQKRYYHHTGYLGHLKETSLKELMAKNPAEVVRKAIYGMLPDNKLRPLLLKNLKIEN